MNDNESLVDEWESEWLPISQMAKEISVNASKISKFVKQGRLQTQSDPLDERVVLVQRKEVYKTFRRKLSRDEKA